MNTSCLTIKWDSGPGFAVHYCAVKEDSYGVPRWWIGKPLGRFAHYTEAHEAAKGLASDNGLTIEPSMYDGKRWDVDGPNAEFKLAVLRAAREAEESAQ